MSAMGADALPAITLDELERLIKMLGLLGSSHDGEVVAAARFVVRWLAEKDTSWEALLVPEEEPGVVSVGTLGGPDPAQLAAEAAKRSYNEGYANGMKAMAAQVKAQAAMQATLNQQAAAQQAYSPHAAWMGLGAGLGGLSGQGVSGQGLGAQAAQAAPGASGGGAGGAGAALQLNPYPTGTWKWVAWELLDRGAKGIPGVFRGSREQDFVRDVLGRGFASLTPAQDTWLRDIAARSGMSW